MHRLFDHYLPRPISKASVVSLPSAKVPARTYFYGQYVTLEPLDASEHAERLYEVSHGEDKAFIWEYMSRGPWPSFEAYEQELRCQSAACDRIFFVIRSLETNEICGQISFLEIDPLNGCIEIGYIWFDRTLRRTRGATDAMFLMIDYAMNELGYRRMQWKCNAFNEGSLRAAKRLGFKFEGILYNRIIVKGFNRDTAYLSILDTEWPGLRVKIKTWLSAENFDSHGLAKTSLTEMMLA